MLRTAAHSERTNDRWPEALAYLDRLMAPVPDDGWAFADRADEFDALKRPEEARADGATAANFGGRLLWLDVAHRSGLAGDWASSAALFARATPTGPKHLRRWAVAAARAGDAASYRAAYAGPTTTLPRDAAQLAAVVRLGTIAPGGCDAGKLVDAAPTVPPANGWRRRRRNPGRVRRSMFGRNASTIFSARKSSEH